MEHYLDPSNLTLPKERTYFTILAFISGLIWLLCVVTIAPLIGLLIGGFIGWLAHGLLVARLRSEAVKVDANQMPALAQAFADVCAKLNVKEIPDLYLMQAGGVLNAFATRHCARDFVVVYSDLLEAYGPDSGEIKFLLGHEIGHLRSRHILKHMFVLPGMFLPLIGSAYSRACESSCDRHGAFASDDAEASVRAMLVLSGGRQAGRTLQPEAFSTQHHNARGFFVSLHELFSGYPTLSKRVSDLLDLQHHRSSPSPERHPFAYILGAFCPGARFGMIGVLGTIYLIAILCGIALPAFSKAKQRAEQIRTQQNPALYQPDNTIPVPPQIPAR